MARKHPPPAVQPPPPESSDEEEASDESEEESSDSEEPNLAQQKRPLSTPSSAQPVAANPRSVKSSSSESEAETHRETESESESDSESESESDPNGKARKESQPTSLGNSTPKRSPVSDSETENSSDGTPQAGKPSESQRARMGQNLKRPQSEVTVEADGAATPLPKRTRHANIQTSQPSVGESSKNLRKFWTDEDELTLLNGVREYVQKTGYVPSANISSFHEFIKDDLRLDALPGQLTNKIRNLKKRFRRCEAELKNGNELKPNMQQCFDLSAKLWDSETGIMKETSSRKASANGATPKKKRNSTKKISIPVAVTLSPPKSVKDEGNKADVATQASLSELHLESSLKDVVSSRFLRNGLSLIDSSQRKKWDEEWKKLTLTELDLAAERHLLLYQMIKMIKDAYKEA